MTTDQLDIAGDVVDLLQQLVDIESVSGNEQRITDAVEAALRTQSHLEVVRYGNVVVAQTQLGRESRVVIAGHLDTVPIANNLPSSRVLLEGREVIMGRGSCDMKSGVAVQLSCAVALVEPTRDITWIFYDNEEVAAEFNGLGKLAQSHPELLAGDIAVLCEGTDARFEGGCQGTIRIEVTTRGTAAHAARSWRGHNAIHDAAEILRRLNEYEPRRVMVEGLEYREGVNAVRITGGIAGNVIPDRCVVEINHRFAPDRSLAEAEAHLREMFDGFDIVVTDGSSAARPGLDLPLTQEFLAAIGGDPVPKFGWTDVARFAEMGMPAVNFGPGDPNVAHTDDEHCPVDNVYACRDALLRWLT